MERVHFGLVIGREIYLFDSSGGSLVQHNNVMLGAGRAEITSTVLFGDRRQTPDILVKPGGGFDVGDAIFDAAQSVYPWIGHFCLPFNL